MDKNLIIKSGVPQDAIIWSIIFLKYINDLSGNLEVNVKLFGDDTLMFSVVSDPINTSQKLKKDLDKVGLWANKWKMFFNPDPSKQAQEIIFFTEVNQSISIINSKAFMDTSCWRDINENIDKANKGIGIIRKLNNILLCHALLTVYRSFIRLDLDYGDVIYDQAENESVSSKIESIQYNATLAKTGAIRRTS